MNYSGVLSLVDIESLANDEIDNGTFCVGELVSVNVVKQDCSVYNRTYKAVYRKDFLYECKGAKGSGSCDKGYVYHYYDCDGYYISSNDQTHVAQCKGEEE